MSYFFRLFIPPIVKNFYKLLFKDRLLYYYGRYTKWDDALKYVKELGEGYDKDSILQREIDAMKEVENGLAAYEQDGVAFLDPNPHFEIMTSIYYALEHKKNDSLVVLDFGGALGSMYYRLTRWIDKERIDWSVVEQKQFVDYGKNYIHQVDFFYSVEDFYEKKTGSFILFSSVLGYLPNGLQVLEECMKRKTPYICVDSTAFYDKEMIMIQHVPEMLYSAEYPVRVFAWSDMLKLFDKHGYDIVFQWQRDGIPIYKRLYFENTEYKGFLIKKK